MNELPPILGVAEVVLNVDDLPAMKLFYQEILGFEVHSQLSMESEEPDPTGQPTICFLTIADQPSPLGRHGHPQLLALIDYRRHVFAARFSGRDPNVSTLNHLAFEIPPDAFDHFVEYLEGNGVETLVTEFPAMQAQAVFFQDPEGNRLELIAHQTAERR